MKEKMKNILKDKTIVLSFISFVIVLIVSGMTFAWFRADVIGNYDAEGVEVTTANLSIVYNGGPEFNEENILPGWTATKTFTVENTGDNVAKYNINWGTLTNDFTNNSDIVYSVTSTNGGGTLSETQLPSTGTNISMINNVSIPVDTTQTYTITFKYLNLAVSQNIDEGSVLSGKIQIQEGQTTASSKFAEQLLENTPPTTYTTVPGRVVATTNEGLIEGPDDDYGDTTYYYRGAVTNNYVSFAELTWRIIRINGDGSVRMILDDYTNTTGSAWNTNYNSTDYTTAMSYITYANSTIKSNVETWYNTNIGNNTTYSSRVATTKFCSDKSGIAEWTGSVQYFAPYRRLSPLANAAPIMTCPDTNDIYNLKVGLITSDEIAFAGGGGGYYLTNQNYYLYNTSLTTPIYWWTLSPTGWLPSSSLNAFIVVATNGSFTSGALSNVRGVRPVISLNDNVTVTNTSSSNPGTSSNPYIIE